MHSKHLLCNIGATCRGNAQETYKTRKELRLVRAEVVMTRRKAFKANWKLDIARADDVLDLEIRKLSVKAELLDDSCVFARRQARVLEIVVSKYDAQHVVLEEPTVLRFGTSHYHLAGSED